MEDFPNEVLFDESEQEDSEDTSFEITDVYPGKTFINCSAVNELQPKLKLFIETMQKINLQMFNLTQSLAKEASNAGGTGQYAINSYAFYSKSLINTLGMLLS